MRPRQKTILRLLLALCLLVPLIIWATLRFFAQPPDPSYAGVPLSTHLYRIYAPRPFPTAPLSPQEIAKLQAKHLAVQKLRVDSRLALGIPEPIVPGYVTGRTLPPTLGPGALPLITNWLATPPPSGWRLKFLTQLQRFIDRPDLTVNRRLIAMSFLTEFPLPIEDPKLTLFATMFAGTNLMEKGMALATVSSLVNRGMKVDTDTALRMLFPISSLSSVTNVSTRHRFSELYFFYGDSRTSADRIIDAIDPRRDLVPLYILEMGPAPARVGAAMELREKPRHPERAIPLLVTNLSSTNRSVIENCVLALGAYGPQARAALPTLTNLLQHPRERIRLATSNTIVAIQRQ